mmetsp:Transcript_12999/g.33256  ORF Transcript_12999/g.33256 Transcript_12999/m.33256 type:complete len:295 (-) Transcript_12999:208-1092(-)
MASRRISSASVIRVPHFPLPLPSPRKCRPRWNRKRHPGPVPPPPIDRRRCSTESGDTCERSSRSEHRSALRKSLVPVRDAATRLSISSVGYASGSSMSNCCFRPAGGPPSVAGFSGGGGVARDLGPRPDRFLGSTESRPLELRDPRGFRWASTSGGVRVRDGGALAGGDETDERARMAAAAEAVSDGCCGPPRDRGCFGGGTYATSSVYTSTSTASSSATSTTVAPGGTTAPAVPAAPNVISLTERRTRFAYGGAGAPVPWPAAPSAAPLSPATSEPYPSSASSTSTSPSPSPS